MFSTLSWFHGAIFALVAIMFLPNILRFIFADLVVAFSDDDPLLMKSIEQARSTINQFWDKFLSCDRAESLFALKVAFELEHGGREHVWVVPSSGPSVLMNGLLMNRPKKLKKWEGETVSFEESQITDWLILSDNDSEGGYSLRAMILTLPDNQARQMAELYRMPYMRSD